MQGCQRQPPVHVRIDRRHHQADRINPFPPQPKNPGVPPSRRGALTAITRLSRLALLRLDREREARLEEALAIVDGAARGTALAELEAWYDAGLGGIFTPPEP